MRPDQLGRQGERHAAKRTPLLVKQLVRDGLGSTQHDHFDPLFSPDCLAPHGADLSYT